MYCFAFGINSSFQRFLMDTNVTFSLNVLKICQCDKVEIKIQEGLKLS